MPRKRKPQAHPLEASPMFKSTKKLPDVEVEAETLPPSDKTSLKVLNQKPEKVLDPELEEIRNKALWSYDLPDLKTYNRLVKYFDDHSEVGGSVAKLFMKCNGSVPLTRKSAPKKVSKAMEDGTEAHKVCESYVGSYLHYKKTGETLDVVSCSDPEVKKRAKEYSKLIYNQMLGGTTANRWWKVEQKLILSPKFGAFGTGDFIGMYLNDRAEYVGVVTDYKNGQFFVPVEDEQFSYYALALMDYMKLIGKELVGVYVSVFQPQISYEMPQHYYTAKQLEKFRAKIYKDFQAIYVNNSYKFVTGDHCLFCPAQDLCAAYGAELDKKSDMLLTDMTKELVVDTFSVEARAKIAKHAAALIKFIETVKEGVRYDMLAGKKFTGLKLIQFRKGSRSFRKDIEDTEIISVLKELGVKDPTRTSLRTITDIEKELKKLKQEFPEKLIEEGAPVLSVVDESNPKPEYVVAEFEIEDMSDFKPQQRHIEVEEFED